MSTPALVQVERNRGAALVTLNRPEKRNALSLELREALAHELSALATAEDVGCVVLTGAGSAFCAGMDTGEFGGDREHRERIVDLSVRLFRVVAALPKPMIAAINGPAVAGGFALALLCDIRLAAEGAQMGFLENRRGIPPSYAAARAAVPPTLAAELCLTGRLLDAEDARRLGVVSSVHPEGELLARAAELAVEIALAPPTASIETKRRILVEREMLRPLFDAEEAALRNALLRD